MRCSSARLCQRRIRRLPQGLCPLDIIHQSLVPLEQHRPSVRSTRDTGPLRSGLLQDMRSEARTGDELVKPRSQLVRVADPALAGVHARDRVDGVVALARVGVRRLLDRALGILAVGDVQRVSDGSLLLIKLSWLMIQ